MKIRTMLLLGWLLGLAAATGQEAKPEAAPPAKPGPEMAPEDTDVPEGPVETDPFAVGGPPETVVKIPVNRGKETRASLQVRFEVWEMETKVLAARLDAVHGSDELEVLRKELLADPAASLLHSLVSSTDEKSRTTDESVLEFIYPTEYEPPETPPAGIDPKDAKKGNPAWERWLESAGKYAVPTSFETRNTGETLEAAVQPVEAEKKTWDVSVSFENVALVGMISYGADDLMIEMPAFSTTRTNGIVRLREDQWRIKSVQEAPRGKDAKPTGKSWLTLVRVDRAR
ncbi:hypothetical protein [Luteolibacter soli]|uniref:Uncharacterized protein n=1 Tax=Luteolibacter soli TaxID=3135280 RepID=A0ABU9ASN7_9BACT